MPTVPRYDQPQAQEAPVTGARANVQTNLDTFGGGQAAAGAVSAFQDVVAKQKKIGDQLQIQDADSKLAELQTKLQVRMSEMRGRDAFGAPEVLDKQWKEEVEKYRGKLGNRDQELAFDSSVNSRWGELNRSMQLHMRDQQRAVDESETNAAIKTSQYAAVQNSYDDNRVGVELDRQRLAISQWAARNGMSGTETETQKLNEIMSQTHRGVIDARVDAGMTKQAKDYLTKNRETMSADDLLHAERTVENSEILGQGTSLYKEASKFKLSTGAPDLARMEAYVNSKSDMDPARKEKVIDIVRAKAAEEYQNFKARQGANDLNFMNAAYGARKQGVPLEQALKLVNKYSRDHQDEAVKNAAIAQIYSTPKESDPITKMALWEKIQNGESSKAEIDEAFKINKLAVSDWETLSKDYYRVNKEGRDPLEKAHQERIQALAEKKFGSDKQAIAEFKAELLYSSQGKSAEERYKIAQDKLKDDPSTGWWIFGKDAQYKADLARRDANATAWGTVHQDVGKKQTSMIIQGLMISGKDKPSLKDVDAFAQQLGGYDAIKVGTPNNEAITALIEQKLPVVPENVELMKKKIEARKRANR